jgi:hypothetical protein
MALVRIHISAPATIRRDLQARRLRLMTGFMRRFHRMRLGTVKARFCPAKFRDHDKHQDGGGPTDECA